MTTSHLRKTFLMGAVLLAYLLLFLPFWKPVVLGFLLATASQPLVRRFRYYMPKSPNLAAWLIWAGLTFLLVGFVVAMAWNAYILAVEIIQNPDTIAGYGQRLNEIKTSFIGWLQSFPMLENKQALRQIQQGLDSAAVSLKNGALEFGRVALVQSPVFMLDLLMFFVAWAAFLMIGPSSVRVVNWFTQDKAEAERRYYDFEETCMVSLGSVFLTALVQALIVVIGASAAGMSALMLIFTVTFVFAMIPVLGAGVAGTLLALAAFAEGNSQGGVILLVTALVAGIVDNIMVAYLFSRAAKTNAAISLISFLGGIAMFGFAGLFIAPVLEQLVMKELNPDREKFFETAAFTDRWRKFKAYLSDHLVPGAHP